jgi:hypothetical protein
VKRVNWPKWFAEMWRADDRRWAVLNSYQALAQHKDLLTDIALRNHVFSPIHAPSDREAAIAEGRRQCALELFTLANVDPATLFERTTVNRTKETSA